MKLELLIVLVFAIMYSVSGISIPQGANKFKGRAAPTGKKQGKATAPADQSAAAEGSSKDGQGHEDSGFGAEIPAAAEPNFETMKAHICSTVQTLPGKSPKVPNFTLDMEMTEHEVFELMMTNMAHDMTSDSVLTFLPENLLWMKQVLDLISSMTKKTCMDAVPVEYINVAKNLFMYYVYKNSFQESMIDPVTGEEMKTEPPNQKMWDSIVDMLHFCHEKTSALMFSSECSMTFQTIWSRLGVVILLGGEHFPTLNVSYVVGRDGSTNYIQPAEEHYDMQTGGSVFGEEIIDAVWHMFSLAYARAYSYNYPLESSVLNFLEGFKKEFLMPLYPRWQTPGNAYNEFFPMIMGNFNLLRAKRNLRACVAATYMYEGIGDRQLVRPLPMALDEEPVPNFKTGRSLF